MQTRPRDPKMAYQQALHRIGVICTAILVKFDKRAARAMRRS